MNRTVTLFAQTVRIGTVSDVMACSKIACDMMTCAAIGSRGIVCTRLHTFFINVLRFVRLRDE